MNRPTATPTIERRGVICDRCGALMQPEVLFHQWHPDTPLLLWRCATGHISQTLPLPESCRPARAQAIPRIGV